MSETTPRGGRKPGEARAALAAALAARAPQRIAQDAIALEELTTRPQLEALAERLERRHAEAQLVAAHGGVGTTGELEVKAFAEDLRRAADVVRAAAVHGYPRPMLEQLGRSAETYAPAARSSDPSTSHAAAPPLVKRGNMLGKLLVGFAAYERTELAFGDDATLTSEELAKRLDLEHTEYAKRCSDLLVLGLIRVARDTDGHERTRQGAAGRQRLVFELTDDGRRVARELGAGR